MQRGIQLRSLILAVSLGVGPVATAAGPSLFATIAQTRPIQLQDPPLRIPANPWLISAEELEGGLFSSIAFSYAELDGRKFQIRDGIAGYVFKGDTLVWVGVQDYFVRGRIGGRVFLDSINYGLRIPIRRQPVLGGWGYAIQVEGTSPQDLKFVGITSSAEYRATTNYGISFLASHNTKSHFMVGYYRSEGKVEVEADSVHAGYRHELSRSDAFQSSLQGVAAFQRIRNGQEMREVKLHFVGNFTYRFTRNWALEGDIMVFPTGVPIYAGRASAIGSFMVYRPGDTLGEVEGEQIAFASLRLTYGYRF